MRRIVYYRGVRLVQSPLCKSYRRAHWSRFRKEFPLCFCDWLIAFGTQITAQSLMDVYAETERTETNGNLTPLSVYRGVVGQERARTVGVTFRHLINGRGSRNKINNYNTLQTRVFQTDYIILCSCS